MNNTRRALIFRRYGDIYRTILSGIYPAKNSTGFPERNLSVNFSKAYEAVAASAHEKAFSWFEFQFGKRNMLHADAVIINQTAADMLIVESKRFNNPSQKIGEILEDAVRISDLVSELSSENEQGIFRINMSQIRHCYGVILADIWTETQRKTDIVNSYLAGVQDPDSPDSFLNKYCGPLLSGRAFPALSYDVCSLQEIEDVQRYHLVSFLWRVF